MAGFSANIHEDPLLYADPREAARPNPDWQNVVRRRMQDPRTCTAYDIENSSVHAPEDATFARDTMFILHSETDWLKVAARFIKEARKYAVLSVHTGKSNDDAVRPQQPGYSSFVEEYWRHSVGSVAANTELLIFGTAFPSVYVFDLRFYDKAAIRTRESLLAVLPPLLLQILIDPTVLKFGERLGEVTVRDFFPIGINVGPFLDISKSYAQARHLALPADTSINPYDRERFVRTQGMPTFWGNDLADEMSLWSWELRLTPRQRCRIRNIAIFALRYVLGAPLMNHPDRYSSLMEGIFSFWDPFLTLSASIFPHAPDLTPNNYVLETFGGGGSDSGHGQMMSHEMLPLPEVLPPEPGRLDQPAGLYRRDDIARPFTNQTPAYVVDTPEAFKPDPAPLPLAEPNPAAYPLARVRSRDLFVTPNQTSSRVENLALLRTALENAGRDCRIKCCFRNDFILPAHCTFCGETGHTARAADSALTCPQAKRFARAGILLPCCHLRCTDRAGHATQVCPTLHSFCGSCNLRGHTSEQCSSSSPAFHSALFTLVADLGRYTQKRHVRPEWGLWPIKQEDAHDGEVRGHSTFPYSQVHLNQMTSADAKQCVVAFNAAIRAKGGIIDPFTFVDMAATEYYAD